MESDQIRSDQIRVEITLHFDIYIDRIRINNKFSIFIPLYFIWTYISYTYSKSARRDLQFNISIDIFLMNNQKVDFWPSTSISKCRQQPTTKLFLELRLVVLINNHYGFVGLALTVGPKKCSHTTDGQTDRKGHFNILIFFKSNY